MKNAMHLLRDGQFDMVFASQGQQSGRGSHTFRNHRHARQNVFERAALAKLKTYIAIPAERPGARKDKVTQSGKAAECFGLAAKGDGKASHLRQAPRN